jgi:hypothetical protein
MIFRSPVITCPDGLYWKGKWEQSQVRGFLRYSSMLISCLSSLHDKYVIVPADKASNNIVFVCKSYYFECLIKEIGINNNTFSNTTYKPTSFSFKRVFNLSCGSVVYRVEKSKVLMEDTWEKDLDLRLSKDL